jgi:hypothetical protein
MALVRIVTINEAQEEFRVRCKDSIAEDNRPIGMYRGFLEFMHPGMTRLKVLNMAAEEGRALGQARKEDRGRAALFDVSYTDKSNLAGYLLYFPDGNLIAVKSFIVNPSEDKEHGYYKKAQIQEALIQRMLGDFCANNISFPLTFRRGTPDYRDFLGVFKKILGSKPKVIKIAPYEDRVVLEAE